MKVLKITAVMLVVAGCLFSCTKKSEAGGEVPFKPCSCDEDNSMQPILYGDGVHGVEKVETYLFSGFPSHELFTRAFPEEIEPFSFRPRYFIVFDRKNDLAWIAEQAIMGSSSSRICNFPDFAKEWVIPEEGLKIYFAGSCYESCEDKEYYGRYGYGDERDEIGVLFHSDFVLTNLKRR